MSESGSLLRHPPPHAALIANAGMGHLIPCIRLAAKLVHHHCLVTLITVQPTVSLAESQFISRFLSSFPQVTHKVFNLLPLDPAAAKSTDPFWLRYDAIRCSIHLLTPLLSLASPPLSVVITDLFLVSPVIPITENLNLPNYILFTSSARMFSLFAHLPTSDQLSGGLDIPGIPPIPKSSIPPLLLNPDSTFASIFFADAQKITKFNGVLINTFEGLEAEAVDAINGNKIGLPPLITIGPFLPCEFEKEESDALALHLKWLDDQPARSVVYVSFGSRTAMSREQIREIGDGLLKSGCKFMWVVKDKVVDKEEEESLIEIVGEELMERLKYKGLVVKDWVDQDGILGHTSVGGFVSHCGWNSVAEAAWHGVPVLAWPLHGDQKINAEVVERSGLGLWASSWGWGGETVVKAEEIGKRIKEVMKNEDLRVQAANIREEARKAVGVGGRSESNLKGLVEDWKKKSRSF